MSGTEITRRAFVATGGSLLLSAALGGNYAYADGSGGGSSAPMFSCKIEPVQSAFSATDSDGLGFESVECGRDVVVDGDRVIATYSVDVLAKDQGILPLAQGSSHDDPLVHVDLSVEYGWDGRDLASSSNIIIYNSIAQITRQSYLLLTGERNHLVYAGILGMRLERKTFDTYSRIDPNWGYVPYSPSGSNDYAQNGARASFEAWPSGMESSRYFVEVICEF